METTNFNPRVFFLTAIQEIDARKARIERTTLAVKRRIDTTCAIACECEKNLRSESCCTRLIFKSRWHNMQQLALSQLDGNMVEYASLHTCCRELARTSELFTKFIEQIEAPCKQSQSQYDQWASPEIQEQQKMLQNFQTHCTQAKKKIQERYSSVVAKWETCTRVWDKTYGLSGEQEAADPNPNSPRNNYIRHAFSRIGENRAPYVEQEEEKEPHRDSLSPAQIEQYITIFVRNLNVLREKEKFIPVQPEGQPSIHMPLLQGERSQEADV